MKKRTAFRTLAFVLCTALLFTLFSPVALAFNAENYKAQITKISIGAPLTDANTGKKYLPVDVHFTASEDLGDSNAVAFLEGYLKATLKDSSTAEGISGLGMTLMGPLKPDALEGMNNAFSWAWSEGAGSGVLKYNIPLLENDDTQSVETSLATGQQEVNGLKAGDSVTFQIETVMTSEVGGGSLMSNDATVTIENDSAYPKEITVGGSGPKTYTLTVNYVGPDGFPAPASKTESGKKEGEEYNVASPPVEGYEYDIAYVKGNMPASDLTVTVTYKKIYELIIDFVFPKKVSGYTGATVYQKYPDGASYDVNLLNAFMGKAVYAARMNVSDGTWVLSKTEIKGQINGADVEETVTLTCTHPESWLLYEDNDSKTHKLKCTACNTVMVAEEPHVPRDAGTFEPVEELNSSNAQKYPNGAYWHCCAICGRYYYVGAEKLELTSVSGTTEEPGEEQGETKTTWSDDSKDGVDLTVKKTEGEDDSFDHFIGAEMDGKPLEEGKDYDKEHGSTIIKLRPAYLNTLSAGEHTLRIIFDYGVVETKLYIKYTANPAIPKTGDTQSTGLWIAFFGVSVLGFAALMILKRRKAANH